MKFPIPCKLLKDESIPGLISRIVLANGYPSLACVAELTGETIKDGLSTANFHNLAVGNFNIKFLADVSENSEAAIVQSLIKVPDIKPCSKSDSQIVTKHWRICPVCLSENNLHHKSWMYSFVTACPKHGKKLIDRCNNCSSTFTTTKPLVSNCPKCGKKLFTAPASKPEIDCSRAINKAISSKTDGKDIESILSRLMTALYFSSSSSLRSRYRYSPQLMTIEAMGQLVQNLWVVAKSDKSLTQNINALSIQLQKRWKHLPYASTLLEKRIQKLGINLPANKHRSLQKTPLYDNNDSWQIPTEIAASAAGISSFVLRRLIKANFIKSEFFSQVRGKSSEGATRLISLDELDSFIDSLHSLAQPSENYKYKKLSSLLQLDIVLGIKDVQNGKTMLFTHGSNGMAGLSVPYQETSSFDTRQSLPKNTISAKEAALKLNTYHSAISSLIKLGYLHLTNPENKNRHYITAESVDCFNQKYLLIGSLAKQLNENPTNLSEKLKNLGITPISSPDIDGSLVTIFQRIDLNDGIFSRVREQPHHSVVTGRKSTVNFESISCPRIKKLAQLVEESGKASKFASDAGISQGNLSMILHEKKTFGNLAARRMEKKLGLNEGWFD